MKAINFFENKRLNKLIRDTEGERVSLSRQNGSFTSIFRNRTGKRLGKEYNCFENGLKGDEIFS